MNICVFGGSIAYGAFDQEKGGWVNRLEAMLDDCKIYNFGIIGDTTEDLLERFDTDIAKKNPDMIIFSIGINDSMYIPKDKNNRINLDKFKENIKKLMEKASRITKKVVFVGLVPVEESKVSPIPWRPSCHYLNAEIEKYNQAIDDLCKANGMIFVDINSEMKKINYPELLNDGIHPNSKGHKFIAQRILKELHN